MKTTNVTPQKVEITNIVLNEHHSKELGIFSWIDLTLTGNVLFSFSVTPRQCILPTVSVHRSHDQGDRMGETFHSWEAVGAHLPELPKEILDQVIELAHKGGNSYCPRK